MTTSDIVDISNDIHNFLLYVHASSKEAFVHVKLTLRHTFPIQCDGRLFTRLVSVEPWAESDERTGMAQP